MTTTGAADAARSSTPQRRTESDAGHALAELTGLVGYIRVSVRGDEPASEDWLPGASLVHDEGVLLTTMRTAMAGRGIDRDDIAMSLIVQGYAFRIASVAIGTWLLAGRAVDVSPANVSIQFGRNRPNAVLVERAAWVTAPPVGDESTADEWAALHAHLIDDHLAAIIETSRRACRVGARMMWANVASSCASSFEALMDPRPDHRGATRTAVQRFFATARPELRTAGEVVVLGPTWAWQRNACCLYYRHAGGSMCGDCSLHDEPARQARYDRLLEEANR
ncbi:MAG: IucA/IucC family C-terminal-domain containing protein [Desertimonas sp.]